MTRNNDNSYRTKGRAVFLAAIMVLSVIAVPLAFSGAAAANQPSTAEEDFDIQPTNDGERLYKGQVATFDADDTSFAGDGQIDLYTTSRDDNNKRILDTFVQIEDVDAKRVGLEHQIRVGLVGRDRVAVGFEDNLPIPVHGNFTTVVTGEIRCR